MLRTLFVGLCLIVSAPITAHAILASFVTIVDRPSGMSIVNGATFGMLGKPNRSYLCGIRVGDSDFSLSTTITSPSGATLTAVRPSTNADALRYLSSFVGTATSDVSAQDNLVFFTAPSGTSEYGKYTFTIGINSGSMNSFTASCIETSIICEFNTFLNQANYLEISNLGSITGSANLKLVNFDGSELSFTNLTYQPGLRKDTDLHTLAGTNKYGFVVVQPLNFAPTLDGFMNPRVSVYKNGELGSSVQCLFGQAPLLG